jgi:mRNA interferase RelE/StbE
MFEIKLDSQAVDFLKKYLLERIVNKLELLKQNPIPNNAKRVLGYEKPTFRIRIGKYRVLYRINFEEKRVIIVKIDKRSKVYRA